MAKYDKFFKLAEQAKIQESELYVNNSTELSFSLFHNEIVEFSNNQSTKINARGIVGDKFGSAASDIWSNAKCQYLVDEIVKNGKVVESNDPALIFKGSKQYKKINTFNKYLSQIDINKKIDLTKQIEAKIRSLDERVIEVEGVGYQENQNIVNLQNSHGLKLQQKSNYCLIYASCVAKEGEQVKSDYDLYFHNNLDNFDIDKFCQKVVLKTVSQLGGYPCETGVYKAVLAPNVVANLIKVYLNNAFAENIQKNSSLFIGKLHELMASPKLTVMETPLEKSVFTRTFDDEGVATYNKTIINKGVLETYVYSLTSAIKENRESTGNGYMSGGAISEGFAQISVKGGKLSQDEIFEKIQNGVYITTVQGLHSGLNVMSGDFSLQSTGFLIKDGKLDHGLDLVTVSGNLVDLFKDILYVGSDLELFPSGVKCPSLAIKKLNISGK